MTKAFNRIPDVITLTTFRCSACGRQFQQVLLGQGEMACPHCQYRYVKVRDEWQSKKWVDFVVAKQRERLDKCSSSKKPRPN